MFLRLGILMLLVVTGCGVLDKDSDDGKNGNGSPDGQASLTIPEARWPASNFCGQETPEIPDDPTPAHRFDIGLLSTNLSTSGLTGWIHGIVPQYDHFLFTYRSEDPEIPSFRRFFLAEQFSLVPANDEIRKTLIDLHRHDKVRLKGSMTATRSAFRHILVDGIEIIKRFDKPTDNNYELKIEDIAKEKEFEVFGKVHAMVSSPQRGYGFVVEHKDLMLPIIVDPKHNDVAAKLFRNDIVNVHAVLVEHENRPPHVTTNPSIDKAIEVIDPLINCHKTKATIEGYLVFFPESPAIKTDVYAVRVVDENGIGRNFTFFPEVILEDTDGMTEKERQEKFNQRFGELFVGLRDKAANAWDNDETDPEVVRNYWKKQSIKVQATGRLNVESTEQANPQIYISDVDLLEIESEK